MCRILKWTFVLIVLAACGQEVDVAEFEPLRGEPVCVGHHNFVVPEGMDFNVRRVAMEGQRIIILPSDGRSARAQMDRHGQPAYMGEPVVDTTIGPWAFTIFDGVNPAAHTRYELGSLLIDDRLVLTFTLQTKSLVPDPAAILPDLTHNTLRVAPYTGQREGFCADGLVFYGYERERGELIQASYGDDERFGSLELSYRHGNVEPLPISPPPGLPAGAPPELRRAYEVVKVDWEDVSRLGQKGLLSWVFGEDRPGALGEVEIGESVGDPTRPYIKLTLETNEGAPEETRDMLRSLIAGLKER